MRRQKTSGIKDCLSVKIYEDSRFVLTCVCLWQGGGAGGSRRAERRTAGPSERRRTGTNNTICLCSIPVIY